MATVKGVFNKNWTLPLNEGLKNLKKRFAEEDKKAKIAVALQLLNWVINGSPREEVKPPIREGILRGSGSVFVGGDLIHTTAELYPEGTPAKSLSEKSDDVITVGFNTAYAARMHETTWTPGGEPPSGPSVKNPAMLRGVGNKFIEKHLIADGAALLELYSTLIKKAAMK